MHKTKTLTLMIVFFLIISLACLETTITPIVDPTPSGDGISALSAASTPPLLDAVAPLAENPAGAVFTIPEEWNEIPRGAPVRKPHKIEVGEIRECLAVAGVCR